ncbi:HepT-like ribonuclease domain-containing protein [Propionibacterium australiense]|uniref:DUF86 domain-containing protein n=1 Tax=Propionibacterium australiense TaxID=119981 RepID=A0A383S4V9_9ACTN|nr:HepT-like ribonuclease domain-containing protein [Propionibacterium australiense]RLP10031.1 DUF86 domain-containing protein [Propionibacterium australiense]SYZ32947.1 Protein of unknown function DUF86 [Propionibacterium australiense]VEH92375.1 Protein of uncharacterised function DUF86 [Propionibacterium australiense]
MSRADEQRLADILASITSIESYQSYLTDGPAQLTQMALDAILRQLGVLGEAARALSGDTTEALPNIPWKSIIGLRNIVVHEYFRIDAATVTDILNNELTELKEGVLSLYDPESD